MIELSVNAENAVKIFDKLAVINLFEGQEKSTDMNLFIPRFRGKGFDVQGIEKALMEVVIDFAVTRRRVKKYYENRSFMGLSKDARSKFRKYTENKGELGELLLYTFLEGELGAPQILSKMSLKTSPNEYVKQSDGIHYLKPKNSDRYYLIFGEAKMTKPLSVGFKKAFESISKHQEDDDKKYEISLISSHIEEEIIEKPDQDLIETILYPSESEHRIKVSDAYGNFIGFEIDDSEGQKKTDDEYEEWLKKKIIATVKNKRTISRIEGYIKDNNLVGETFYVYLLPFTDLETTREQLTKGITE